MTDTETTQERYLPWRDESLGTHVEGVGRADEAIKRAGLDWEVSLRPLAFRDQRSSHHRIPDRFAIVRDDEEKYLGNCTKVYRPFQNREAFSFMDNLVDDGLVYEDAGTMRDDKVVWVTAKVPEGITVAGEDEHDLYLFLRTTHDGGGAIRVMVTPIRLTCTNMMNMITREAKREFKVNHTSTAEGKLQDAREVLGLAFNYRDAFQKEAERLLEVEVSEEKFREIVQDLWPETPQREKRVQAVEDVYHTSPNIAGYRGTGWGALNAVGEYFDWARPVRTPQSRLIGTMEGAGLKARDRVKEALLASA